MSYKGTDWNDPSDWIIDTFMAVFAISFAALWLSFTILWGLSNEDAAIAQIKSRWHPVVATSYGHNIITANGNSSRATYTLDGVTHHTTLYWGCYSIGAGEVPNPGTAVQIYADNAGHTYCNLADDSAVPRASYNPLMIFANVVGTIFSAIVGLLVGAAMAYVGWALGWWVGMLFDKKKVATSS